MSVARDVGRAGRVAVLVSLTTATLAGVIPQTEEFDHDYAAYAAVLRASPSTRRSFRARAPPPNAPSSGSS